MAAIDDAANANSFDHLVSAELGGTSTPMARAKFEAAFAAVNQQRADAIVVSSSPFFLTRAKQIVSLAAQYREPAIYVRREFTGAGGLMSYGYDVSDGYRQILNFLSDIFETYMGTGLRLVRCGQHFFPLVRDASAG